MAIRDTIRRMVLRYFSPAATVDPNRTDLEARQKSRQGTGLRVADTVGDQYYNFVDQFEQGRLAGYKDYELMDFESVEVSRALDDLADLIVVSQQGDWVPIEILSSNIRVKAMIDQLNHRTYLPARMWSIARQSIKMGDDFEEIVIDSDHQIVRVKSLPCSCVYRHEDEFGLLEPIAFTEEINEKVVAEFEAWQVVHFRNDRPRDSKYGRSILYSLRRLWRQLQLIEDSMVITRLARAPMRYKFKIPGGDLGPEGQKELIELYRDLYQKRKVIDPSTGQISWERSALTPDTDFFVPTSKENPSDIDVLEGAAHLAEIADIEYFQTKFVCRLEVPKAMLGFEKEVNAKATLTTQDRHLARKINRRRQEIVAGLRQIYDLQLILEGLDPQAPANAYVVKFPGIASEDDLNRAEVGKIEAQTAEIWRKVGLPIDYLLRAFLELSDAEILQIQIAMAKEQPPPGEPGDDDTAAAELDDQRLLRATEQYLISKERLDEAELVRQLAEGNGQ